MALIVEDGSIVTNANTYASVDDLEAFATLRGIVLTGDDTAKEILLIKAMDYIEAQEYRFKGYRRTAEQFLSWPRTHVVLYYTERYRTVNGYENISQGQFFPDNAIPSLLIKAQCQLACDAVDLDLMPTVTTASRSIRREKVGPLETEFFSNKEQISAPMMAKAEALLFQLCTITGFGLTIGRA